MPLGIAQGYSSILYSETMNRVTKWLLYGFAWWLNPIQGHRRIGHTGETSGFNASFERFPDDQLAIIVLCNSGEGERADNLAKAIASLYFNVRRGKIIAGRVTAQNRQTVTPGLFW